MAKVRVSDLAKKMNIPDKDLIFKLQSLGVQVEDSSQALDNEVIVAILTGKKLASRPRTVIIRDEKPQPEKKAGVVVRPPRPIVKTEPKTRRAVTEEAAPAAPPAGPIIPEFVEAAEAEAAEQERAAKEAPKPARTRKAPAAPASEPAAPIAAAPEQQPAATPVPPTPAAPQQQQPAAAAAANDDRRPTGATGPRARMTPTPRPNYQGQQPVYQQRPPQGSGAPSGQRPQGGGTGYPQREQGSGYQGNRPAGGGYQGNRPAGGGYQGGGGGGYQGNRPAGGGAGYQGNRPAGGGGGYQGNRPAGGGYQGNRPAGGGYQGGGGGGYQGNRPAGGGYQGNRPPGQGFRPGGSRPGGMMPPPPSAAPPAPALRRKKSESEDDRPEKKKTTGKRGKRAPNVVEEDLQLFSKGPFSAGTVLDDDAPEIGPRPVIEGQESEEEDIRRAPSARRDARKQQAPITGKVLDFKRPTGKVTLSEGVTVKDLADKLDVKASDLMKHLLMKKGLMLSINAPLGSELALEIAKDLGLEAELVSYEEALELVSLEKIASSSGTVSRGPVITVMGHVDHGKTSLLDSIRETNVAGGEAGGITQHIGAYAVEKRGRKIVFLDTPGHEAFTMMRARGAKVTDIVILVVAADDGVMPQTKEAIDHARAAKVPMIVAINKIDKPNANVERVRRELSEAGVLVEQWGGDVVSVEVSAVKKQGIDDLLEMILLTADILDAKATPELPARGVVLEARKETGRGIVATVLVQDGTLKIGDPFFSGLATGRVRAMTDDHGERVNEAGPATPVSVTGFDDIPNAGDSFLVVDEESQARLISEQRQQRAREQMQQKAQRMSLEQLFQKMQTGAVKDLNLIVKADVQGSVEVLGETLRKVSNEQVKLNVLHSSVGAISTNDVLLASASDAIIVGFNVRPERNASELAEKEGVDIRLHTVIYNLIDEIKAAMTGLLDPTLQEVFQGRAEVRNTFKVPKVGTIAGCYVTEGTIPRTAGVRLLRDNRVIYEGKISSLKHFKNDVSEVRTGFECGIGIEKFQDIKVGDVIESYKIEKLAGVLA
jgi:translation initiation factor IF-2